MAYVYKHTRIDNNEIFYIGIGGSENNYDRAYTKHGRNRYWKRIAGKTNYNVEIIEDNLSWEAACELEKYWIKFYGRFDLKEGTLVNMTDGGDGILNISDEVKNKISKAHKGKKLSKEHINKLKESHMGIVSGNKGKQHSEETKKLISEKCKGVKRPTRVGIPLSEEHKEKLKKAHTKRIYKPIHTEESKKRIGEKNRINLLGKKVSNTARKNMSEGQKLRWVKHKEKISNSTNNFW